MGSFFHIRMIGSDNNNRIIVSAILFKNIDGLV